MLDDATIIDKISIGIVGLGAGGYALWRRLKKDNTTDTINNNAIQLAEHADDKTQKLIENLQLIITSKTEDCRAKDVAIERLASERNEAVQKVGNLEATVEHLGDKVERMTNEMARMETENRELANRVNSLIEALKDLGTRVVDLATQNQILVAELQIKIGQGHEVSGHN